MDKSGFTIPLNGLAQGKTETVFTVGKDFFESFENTDILDASLKVDVEVEKSGRYTGVDCHIEGTVSVECDRCLDLLDIPVSTVARLSIKTGSGTGDEAQDDGSGREVVWLPEDNAELDIAQVIYDYVCISLPMKRIHPDGKCKRKVLEYLEEGIKVSDGNRESGQNPFAVLNGLFDN